MDPPVLLLDEPTSNLDATTEAGVMSALRRLRAGRTTLVIAHRLSTVRDADLVVRLEAGRIVVVGPGEKFFSDLMAGERPELAEAAT
jgi:subfamily B ATP-binding cassette protein MsbA